MKHSSKELLIMVCSIFWVCFWAVMKFTGLGFTVFLIGGVVLKRADEIIFDRYQENKHNELMDYARNGGHPLEKPEGRNNPSIKEKTNAVEKPIFKDYIPVDTVLIEMWCDN